MTDTVEELRTIDPYGVDHDHGDVDFYWGVAAGSTHAALRRAWSDPSVPTPERMMLNHATQNNQVWEGPRWFIDCGGAPDTMKASGGHKTTVEEYLAYLRDPPTKYGDDLDDVTIERAALRDWPCEPGVLEATGHTVEDHIELTLADAISMYDRVDSLGIEPVAVLQGWEIGDYLDCLDRFLGHGIVTDTLGIGSVCRRGSINEIEDIVHRIRKAVPPRVDLHGFGVKRNVLETPSALTVFDSVDSTAWEYLARKATQDGCERGPPIDGMGYADWVDWDDRGNPRYTWRNVQLCFVGYHDNVEGILSKLVDRDLRFVDIADWPDAYDDLDGDGWRYPLLKCVCGTLVDVGAPDPVPEPGCRFCERGAIDIWDRRLAAEAELS